MYFHGVTEKDKLTLSFCGTEAIMDKDKVNESDWFRDWAQVLYNEYVEQKKLKLSHTIAGRRQFAQERGAS